MYKYIHITVGGTYLESAVQKAAPPRNFPCLRRMRMGCRPNEASKMAEGLKAAINEAATSTQSLLGYMDLVYLNMSKEQTR